MIKTCVRPLSRSNIAAITNSIRKTLKAENIEYFPIVNFIELVLCHPEIGIELEIVDVSEMDNVYALADTTRNCLRIREDVYEGAVAGKPRDRFTLCHEVGHFILHQPDCVEFARGNIPTYRDPEWQANTFAGELMAPSSLILQNKLSPEEISEKCGMSYTAAKIQYENAQKLRC